MAKGIGTITVLGSPIIAGNFGEVIFSKDFKFYDGLKMDVVALTSPKDPKTGARRKRSENSRIELVSDHTVLWSVTFHRRCSPFGDEEYTLVVERIRDCTKTSEACTGELSFMGKPKNQKSFRGQKLRKGSFIPEYDNLGFRCNCTSSLRKGHHRTESYCISVQGVLVSNPFIIRGRPTGSKRPVLNVQASTYSMSPTHPSYQFTYGGPYPLGMESNEGEHSSQESSPESPSYSKMEMRSMGRDEYSSRESVAQIEASVHPLSGEIRYKRSRLDPYPSECPIDSPTIWYRSIRTIDDVYPVKSEYQLAAMNPMASQYNGTDFAAAQMLLNLSCPSESY